MTYRQIIYMCLDELKLISDDSYFTEDHILFLVTKYRAMLLKQKYSDIKKQIPDSNYQTIYLNVEPITLQEGTYSGGNYLRSVEEIPNIMQIGIPRVYSLDYYKGEITYTNRDRMKYTGYNKYTKNIVYCSLNTDNHLYFKSNSLPELTKVKMTCIFQNSLDASNLEKDINSEELDREVPLEEDLVSQLIQLIVKELAGPSWKPIDSTNNASDDLADLATFIARNVKSRLQKQIEE